MGIFRMLGEVIGKALKPSSPSLHQNSRNSTPNEPSPKQISLPTAIQSANNLPSTDTCPHCAEKLEKIPKRKAKCPHCSEYIYVRSGQLCTEKMANEADVSREVIFAMRSLGFEIDENTIMSFGLELSSRTGQPFDPSRFLLAFIDDAIAKSRGKSTTIMVLKNVKMIAIGKLSGTIEGGIAPKELIKETKALHIAKLKELAECFTEALLHIGDPKCDLCKTWLGKRISISDARKRLPYDLAQCSRLKAGERLCWMNIGVDDQCGTK